MSSCFSPPQTPRSRPATNRRRSGRLPPAPPAPPPGSPCPAGSGVTRCDKPGRRPCRRLAPGESAQSAAGETPEPVPALLSAAPAGRARPSSALPLPPRRQDQPPPNAGTKPTPGCASDALQPRLRSGRLPAAASAGSEGARAAPTSGKPRPSRTCARRRGGAGVGRAAGRRGGVNGRRARRLARAGRSLRPEAATPPAYSLRPVPSVPVAGPLLPHPPRAPAVLPFQQAGVTRRRPPRTADCGSGL